MRRKLSIVLMSLMLMTSSVYAQSAKEIFNAIGKIPTSAEATAALKTAEPFAARIKSLENVISTFEKKMEDLSFHQTPIANSKMPNMTSDPDGWAKAMEKRSAAQEKMNALADGQMGIMMLHGKYEGRLTEFKNTYEEDPIYGEKYQMLQTKHGKRSSNKSEYLAQANKFMKELYALDCEVASDKLNKLLDIIREYFNELNAGKAKLIELDEATEEFYNLTDNPVGAAGNPVRGALILFSKTYKGILEGCQPPKLIQYKTYEEAVQEGN